MNYLKLYHVNRLVDPKVTLENLVLTVQRDMNNNSNRLSRVVQSIDSDERGWLSIKVLEMDLDGKQKERYLGSYRVELS